MRQILQFLSHWGKEPQLSPKLSEVTDDELVKLAKALRASSMDALVIFTLEMSKPLSFVLSQAMVAFEPLIGVALDTTPYIKIAYLLADRDRVEKLIKLLEMRELPDDRRDKDESRVQSEKR